MPGDELNRVAMARQQAAPDEAQGESKSGGKLLRHPSSLSGGVVGQHVVEPPERRVGVGSAKLK